MNTVGELYDLLCSSPSTVVFTGAGVSTASGIRDFRGPNGIYRDKLGKYTVEELFGIELFDQDPTLFYQWAKGFVYDLHAFKPNIVHHVLAKLEERGLVQSIITQNIDRLHTLAGSRSVYELHGSAQWHTCRSCQHRLAYEEVLPLVHAATDYPRCPRCGGVLKPDITFYGEALPEEAFQKSLEACQNADLCLVLGSSLTVTPAAYLPREAYNFGARLVIVNGTPTPLDRCALLRFNDLVATFTELETFLE